MVGNAQIEMKISLGKRLRFDFGNIISLGTSADPGSLCALKNYLPSFLKPLHRCCDLSQNALQSAKGVSPALHGNLWASNRLGALGKARGFSV